MKRIKILILTTSLMIVSTINAEENESWRPFFSPKAKKSEIALDALKTKNRCAEFLMGNGGEARAYAHVDYRRAVPSFKTVKHYFISRSKDGLKSATEDELILRGAKQILGRFLKPFRVIDVYKREGSVLELELIEGLSIEKLYESKDENDPNILRLMERYRISLDKAFRALKMAGFYVYLLDPEYPDTGFSVKFTYQRQALELTVYWTNILVDANTGEFIINDPK